MERVDAEVEWKTKIDNAYQEWKYNEIHKNIKTFFNDANKRSNIPEALKHLVDIGHAPFLSEDLTQLRNDVEDDERQNQRTVFVRDSNQNISFLGAKIEVSHEAADDEQVMCISLCKTC